MSMCCSFKGCPNVQRTFSSKTFFNLPNDSRREIWIKNSGNDELRSVSATQRRLFCEDHFDPKYLRCQFNRTTLRRDAVPYPCDEVPEAQEEVEFIEMEDSEDENDGTQSDLLETEEDQTNVIILLNNLQNTQNSNVTAVQTDREASFVEAPASKLRQSNKMLNTLLSNPQNSTATAVQMDREATFVEAPASRLRQSNKMLNTLLSNPQNSTAIAVQMDREATFVEASASKPVSMQGSPKSIENPSKDVDREVELEVDLIVVDENNQITESNESGHAPTASKRLRFEIEPCTNQANESSQNVVKEIKATSVPIRSNTAQPSKSIEEIVSSSEVTDTNNEDKYFALSILGTLRRLTPHKRALAKCHILSYLTEIEYGSSNPTT